MKDEVYICGFRQGTFVREASHPTQNEISVDIGVLNPQLWDN